MFSFRKNSVILAKKVNAPLRRGFSSKSLMFGSEARNQILLGCTKLTDAVKVTLGPKGRNVIIEQSFGSPKVTKDGVTVAKAITLKNPTMNLGAQMIKSVASATNDSAGDGTTTASILAHSIFKGGCKAVDSGMNPMDLLRGIKLATEKVVEYLNQTKKVITMPDEILNVATNSANGDKHIGRLITNAIKEVGKEGTITVTEGKTLEHELEKVEGLQLDRGYISPYFITNQKELKVELINPYILIFDKKLNAITNIIPALEHVAREQAPLLIIAEDVEGEALAALVVNKIRSIIQVCAVKAPGFGDHRKALLQDIAIMTGSVVINEETGTKLDNTTVAGLFGKAKNVKVSKDSTIILEGNGDKNKINERLEQLRLLICKATSEYEKEKLQERLAKMTGGVAIIKVGGASEMEVSEIKDRIQDSLCATKAAVEEGIVPGGGSALIFASKTLDQIKTENYDQKVGVDIVKNACLCPCYMIAENAGHEGAVIVGKLLEETDTHKGFDAQKGKFVNMIDEGIIDPVKVIKSAISDAASFASLMTTTEVAIYDEPEVKSANENIPPAGMGGGMPGIF